MQIDLTETELYILQKGMCLIRDSIRKQHEEMIAIHIQEKLRDALAELEDEKTYPVQAIFEDKDGKYMPGDMMKTANGSDGNVVFLNYLDNSTNFAVYKDFYTHKYHRRERKNNA